MSFCMAYSINERSSFTLGYKHDFIGETESEVNGVDLTAPSLSVGSLLLGYSFQVNNYASTNLNLELGITDDAPDVLMTFDRKSVVQGKSVSVRVDLGGRRLIKKKTKTQK